MVQIVKVIALISYILVGNSLAEEGEYVYFPAAEDHPNIRGRAPITYLPAMMLYNILNPPQSRSDPNQRTYVILQQYCMGPDPRYGIVRMTDRHYTPIDQSWSTWIIRCDVGYDCQEQKIPGVEEFWDEPEQLHDKRAFIYCKKSQ